MVWGAIQGTTIRKAQGASLEAVVLFFDHCYPPERGYAYVGASRAQSKAGLYHYGRLRRSDWLPVGEPSDEDQLERGYSSESNSSVDDDGEDENAYEDDRSDALTESDAGSGEDEGAYEDDRSEMDSDAEDSEGGDYGDSGSIDDYDDYDDYGDRGSIDDDEDYDHGDHEGGYESHEEWEYDDPNAEPYYGDDTATL